ncbi:MAG: FAD-binding oxidoreductase [Pleurocapsa sp.]
MTNAIATQLQSLINNETELIELGSADSYWQEKLDKVVIDSSSPIYLVFPQTVEILTAIVREAQQQQWGILVCGSGSKLDWGGSLKNIQLVVSTQKCHRLIEHAVGDLTVTVEAGMKLADLQAQLHLHHQFLPIDPIYPQSATIGGIIATGDTGSWRQRYGGIRDMLLGLSFVRADGKIAKAGGRVVKNVAGYDLMKLFTGSYGTLGIISQATFRTYPLPKSSQTLLLTGESDAIAKATQTIRNSGLTPTAMDLVSALICDRLNLGKQISVSIRFQTIAESITQQAEQIEAIARQLNLVVNSYRDRDELDLWKNISAIARIPDSESSITCKIGIIPSQAVDFLHHLTTITNNQTLAVIHGGSGIGQLQLSNEDLIVLKKLRSRLQQNNGFLTVLTAPKSVKEQVDVWGYSGNALKAMQAIKNNFDPQHILNPGRFLV